MESHGDDDVDDWEKMDVHIHTMYLHMCMSLFIMKQLARFGQAFEPNLALACKCQPTSQSAIGLHSIRSLAVANFERLGEPSHSEAPPPSS